MMHNMGSGTVGPLQSNEYPPELSRAFHVLIKINGNLAAHRKYVGCFIIRSMDAGIVSTVWSFNRGFLIASPCIRLARTLASL